jgi:ADP-heptose:LPS heptosyltransferase
MKNNILVLNNHGLGDVVMSFNFFDNLLDNDKVSKVLVLFKSNLEKELFTFTKLYNKNKNRFKLYNMNEIKKLFIYIFRIKKAYALGVNEVKSKKLFKLLGIKNYYLAHPYEYTKSKSENLLHNEQILHKSTLYSSLLKVSDSYSLDDVSKDFFIDTDRGGVNDIAKYIVLTGGSGELEKHKRWTTTGYRELVKKILDNTEYKIVFVGSSGEQKIVDEILLDTENKYMENIIQLNGKTNLKELIYILRNSSLVVGNDNGVLHIASACDSKILGLFGSTDCKITGPVGNYVEIIDNRIECAPCYAKDGNIEGCEDNTCMKSISAEQVYQKVIRILDIE